MARLIGNILLAVGVAVLLYGLLAFYVLQGLAPNGGPSGRLPSLYIIFAGLAALLIGAVTRNFRLK